MLSQNFSQTTIAATIGKDKSVVSRELRRNCDMRSGEYRYGRGIVSDRATGLCWLALLGGKESEPLKDALIKKLSPLKGDIKTATADNGKEFAAHREIAAAIGIDVFFAHQYHPRERGANENMNGLIRQYIPKRSSFENLNDKDILLIQNKLNNRPRKKIKFFDPY